MKSFKLLIFLCFIHKAKPIEKARFDNYRVHEITIEDEMQLNLLKAIDEFPDGVSFFKIDSNREKLFS